MINWDSTKEESKTARLIAQRAHRLNSDYAVRDAEMDIMAAHLNGCPLKLEELLKAGDGDFGHDVFEIRRLLDRTTGKLPEVFLPRYAR